MQRPQNWIPEIEYYKIMSLNGAEKQLSKVNVVGGMQPNIATAIGGMEHDIYMKCANKITCPNDIPGSPAFQVALNPLLWPSWSSLRKMTTIVLSELMMGLGLLDPQYLCSSDPNETLT